MNEVFLEQQIEELEKYGYLRLAAGEDFLKSFMDTLKRPFPRLQAVTSVGDGSIHQIIYLPKARQKVIGFLQADLLRFDRDAANTRKALKGLQSRSA